MFNIFENIEENLTRKKAIKTDRIPTHMPSRSMCDSKIDGKAIGHCLRSAYFSRLEYPVSNPLGIYTIMAAQAGLLWEDWLINQVKEMGIYLAHSTKIYDPLSFMSGEIDIVHINPLTEEVELTECKQYNGSNYYAASELKGSSNKDPKPKDQHLLQTFDYLIMCRNTGNDIKYSNLVYIDRSCANYSNNVQFRVSLKTVGKEVHPFVEYFSKGQVESYTDFRITEKGVLEKNNKLDLAVDSQEIPAKEYTHNYSEEVIQDMILKKEIAASRITKWKQDPIKNPIGDWQCRFCPYGPDLSGNSTCFSV